MSSGQTRRRRPGGIPTDLLLEHCCRSSFREGAVRVFSQFGRISFFQIIESRRRFRISFLPLSLVESADDEDVREVSRCVPAAESHPLRSSRLPSAVYHFVTDLCMSRGVGDGRISLLRSSSSPVPLHSTPKSRFLSFSPILLTMGCLSMRISVQRSPQDICVG